MAVHLIHTGAIATDKESLIGNADRGARISLGSATDDSTEEFCHAYIVDSNKSVPSRTWSMVDTQLVHVINVPNTDADEATHSAESSTSYTLDWVNILSGDAARLALAETISNDVVIGVEFGTIEISSFAPTIEVVPLVNVFTGLVELATFVHVTEVEVLAPLSTLELAPLGTDAVVEVTTPLGTVELVPLGTDGVVEVAAPLSDLELVSLLTVVETEVVAPFEVIELSPLGTEGEIEVALDLTALEIQPLAPIIQVEVGVTIPDQIQLESLGVEVIVDVVVGVPLGFITFESMGTIIAGADVLTNYKRIYDAVAANIKAATFQKVTFDGTLCVMVEGATVTPTFELDEVKSGFLREPRRNRRRLQQERGDWEWKLVLKFPKAATTELFEAAWILDPIRLDEDTMNGLAQVTLLLEESNTKHPPHQGASNGSEVTYRLVAELHAN